MKKTFLKGTPIVLCMVGLLCLNGCGRCIRWETRDVTRSECTGWSAGNCTGYRYYTVQERYCAEREGKEGEVPAEKKATKEQKTVFLLDVATGKEIRQIPYFYTPWFSNSPALSPDGRFALSTGGKIHRSNLENMISARKEVAEFMRSASGK